jgi:hypothetical protein
VQGAKFHIFKVLLARKGPSEEPFGLGKQLRARKSPSIHLPARPYLAGKSQLVRQLHRVRRALSSPNTSEDSKARSLPYILQRAPTRPETLASPKALPSQNDFM